MPCPLSFPGGSSSGWPLPGLWLATKPHIVLADEPTGNLDSKTSLEVMLLLERLNRELSQTILMITHNEELAQMTARRIRIEDGRILSDSGEVAG